MLPKLLAACFLLFALCANAQPPSPATAAVSVTVTNGNGQPLANESVLFSAKSSGKTVACRTDEKGGATLTLPIGDTYLIKLKTMTDTAMQGSLDIPALAGGRRYTAPFTVEIEFDPPRSFTLNNVHFDTGKPTLRSESFASLNEIADYMKWKPGERYEVAGHTDNVGKDADNQRLSQARAESVRAYLVKRGVAAQRLAAKGYGAAKPVADNTTPEGRQQNRRTEVVIL